VIIRAAKFPQDMAEIVRIFRDYAEHVKVDLCFQDFDTEIATLPGKYAEPQGQVLLATSDERAVGCVALRPLSRSIGEMKRLFVRPAAQGTGLGRKLAVAICNEARAKGYTHLRLDTLPDMHAAQQLYFSLGFKPITAYTHNPIAGSIYMECDLIQAELQ
jgi:N-acetylglutamate synthase-like GNAT family acetyltransferase